MRQVILAAKDLCKRFGAQTVLDHVCVEIEQGEFAVIMGPSGAGKSTLLYALSGMDTADGGEVLFRGQPLNGRSEREMALLRAREFGFVFQQAHLVSNLTLLENATVAGFLARVPRAGEKAGERLKRMGVGHAMDRLPHQVSGGEAQRAAIARAMMGDPGLLFADEPTGALNKRASQDILDLLTGLHGSGQTILMVTHDLRSALRGDRILYLEDGRILDQLRLTPYEQAADLPAREEYINQWLSGLSW